MKTQLPFPKTQAEMTQYQEKKTSGEYSFDGTNWYSGSSQTLEGIQSGITALQGRIDTEGVTVGGVPSVTEPLVVQDPKPAPIDISHATSREDFYTKQLEILRQQEEERITRQEEARKEAEKTSTMWDKFLGKPGTEEKRDIEFEEIGVDAKEFFAEQEAGIAEIESLRNDYDSTVAMKDQSMLREENRLGTMQTISGRMNVVEKEWNIRLSQKAAGINTKLAIMEMQNGNFEQARSFVDQAVRDYTYDMKLEYDMIQKFEDDNKDAIAELDAEYKDILAETKNIIFGRFEFEEAKAKDIGNLMLQYPTAGITFEDTMEQAIAKGSRWAAAQPTTTGAPTVIGTEATGYMQWDAATGTWKPIEGLGITEEGWTDENIRIAIRNMVAAGHDRQFIFDQFESDPTVIDKSRARLIAGELLDTPPTEGTKKGFFSWGGTQTPKAEPLTAEQRAAMKKMGFSVPDLPTAPQEKYIPGQGGIDIGATSDSFINQLYLK